jgi:hypothetical protein
MVEETDEYNAGGRPPAREPSMGKRPETEKEKKQVGRKRYRAISKIAVSVKLFNGSKRHIDTMVREFKNSDPIFASVGSAVRHYVHVGISAEAASTDLRWTLDYSPIKKAQKDAVREELKPHSGNIKNLQVKIDALMLESGQLFNDLTKRTENIEAKLDAGFEDAITRLEKLLATGDQSFKNIAVLRSLFYIFLLGIQTGKINTGKENLAQWNNIVKLAHEKANEFAAQELRELSTGRMESDVIKNLTLQIFTHVKNATILREEPTRPFKIVKEQMQPKM